MNGNRPLLSADRPLHLLAALLLSMLIGASLASFIGFAVAQFAFGVPLLDDPSILDRREDPSLTPVLRMLQILQAVGMLVLPALFILWKMEGNTRLRNLFPSPARQPVLLSIALFPVLIPFVHYTASLNSAIALPGAFGEWAAEKEAAIAELTLRFLDMPHAGLLLVNLFMVALLPAVGEELLFRGIFQRLLVRHNINAHLAIWLAAVVFSAIHVQFLSFLPRVLMGAVLGYLLLWSGSLWYPVIAHFTNNAAAVILHYASQHGLTNIDINSPGGDNPATVAMSLGLTVMLLYLFRAHQQGQAQSP